MNLQSHPTIDAFELARDGGTVEGLLPLAALPRLAAALARSDGVLSYRIVGGLDDMSRPGAAMQLRGELALECQRCNAVFTHRMARDAKFRFVDSEAALNALPIEDDEVDVIVGSRRLDLAGWIEDEAILSLPLVPRHDRGDAECRPVVPVGEHDDAGEGSLTKARASPFAALADLKDGSGQK